MFRKMLTLALVVPILTNSLSTIVACSWDLEPNVLLLTSYKNAENQNDNDEIVFKNLTKIYGENHVTTLFNVQDDNQYATTLRYLLSTYNIKKVFVLNPIFKNYLPHDSATSAFFTNNLVRVLQQFNDVNFYFFNNIIADTIKITNNIYDIRFDTPNIANPNPPNSYGQSLADHFSVDVENGIKNGSYIFNADTLGNIVVNVGIINNIGTSYQQKILNDFIHEINSKNFTFAKFNFILVNPHDTILTTDIHSSDAIQIVGKIAQNLYENQAVNFIINSNSWYNDIIAHSARSAINNPQNSKTIKFIGSQITNSDNYLYKNYNALAFGFIAKWDILEETAKPEIDSSFKIPSTAGELEDKIKTYGVNGTLEFIG